MKIHNYTIHSLAAFMFSMLYEIVLLAFMLVWHKVFSSPNFEMSLIQLNINCKSIKCLFLSGCLFWHYYRNQILNTCDKTILFSKKLFLFVSFRRVMSTKWWCKILSNYKVLVKSDMFDGYSSIIETYIVQWQGLGCSGHRPSLLLFHSISLLFEQRQYHL